MNLVFLLGDQLSPSVSALEGCDRARDIVLMAEVADEASYVSHHKKKLAFIFAAMRAFAGELRGLGWKVDYVRLDDPANTGSLTGELARAIARHKPGAVIATEAAEWRVLEMQEGWRESPGVEVDIRPDRRFVCSREEFAAWAQGRKQLRMEYFYREMRRKTGLLMDGGEPAGGQWNFDHDNRKPAKADLFMPQPVRVAPDENTRVVLAMVAERFADNFGDLDPFWFPVTRADSQKAVQRFLKEALPRFGDFQDAMLRGEKFLYHALLSPLINVGLVDPLELCRQAEAEYRAGRAPLNAVEGFIRQIIGWREYVRGIYWLGMPGYTARTELGATRPLPWMYWSGETNMACMGAAIGQTKEEAYAHHIQRLMVTGNFALLAGIDPHQTHEWYLAVYMDAFEWVEAPNTIGMSQFADGGWLASKPYAASGAYIDRMSDYCSGCRYKVKARTGPGACPFNALYWDFLNRHRKRFERNPRMAQMYRTYDRVAESERSAIQTHAARFLAHVDAHGTDIEWEG
ncbi:MAG TPA: cryptochrome/photolyase family protein [Rhizobiaceae bacterium]|nr:cryptochrome/photolyase family protein [Rhizobiaceae bacterium]